MDAQTAAAFERMKQADPGNRNCLECAAPDPQWCTLSYGAFLCLNCSGLHRGLGVHLSFVRSSTMDSWQPQQMKLMEAGGNTKCKDFFVEHGLWELPLQTRYATKAAAYYRALLRSLADPSVSPPAPLNPDEVASPDTPGTTTPNCSLSSSPCVRSLGSGPQPQQQEDEGLLAALQQQAAAASAAAAAAAASVSSSSGVALDSALQSVSSFVSGAKELTVKTIEAANESSFVEKAKGGFQTGSEWITQQGKKISSTFAGGSSPEDASSDTSSPKQQEDQQQEEQQQQQEGPSRSSSSSSSTGGMFQSMFSTAKELTSRSLSNVSQVVRSGSNTAANEVSVLDKAREGLSSVS